MIFLLIFSKFSVDGFFFNFRFIFIIFHLFSFLLVYFPFVFRIQKYSNKLGHSSPVYTVFSNINIERNNEIYLLQLYNNLTDRHSEVSYTDKTQLDNIVQHDKILNNANDKTHLYDEIACRFIKENEQSFRDMTGELGE